MPVNIKAMTPARVNSCPPLLLKHVDRSDAERLSALFRVLGDASRLQLLSLIASQPHQTACACELVEPLGLSQPTVSHHLKVMYEAGFLEKERRGTWIYYRVVPETLQILGNFLQFTPLHLAIAAPSPPLLGATE